MPPPKPPRIDRGTLVIVVAWVVACVAWIRPGMLVPDGVGYWSWLSSALIDRDLLLFDQWQLAGMTQDGRYLHQWVTPTLHLANHWGPGAAIAWSPGYLLADLASRGVPALAEFPRDGLRLPHVAGALVVDALCALGAALLGRDAARRFAPDQATVLAALGTLFGSPLLFYGLRGGFAAHAVAAFAGTLATWLALKLRDGVTPGRLLACGLACGYAACVRPQLAALVALPCLIVPARQLLASMRGLLALAAGLVAGVLPQVVVSCFVYGHPLGALAGGPGPAGRPYAAFERFWTWEPWLSAWHGVVPWTPFLAVGLVGLALLARADRRLGVAAGLVVLSQAFAIATLDRPFWGAFGFGQRRLDGLTGLLLVGAAFALARLPRIAAAALAAACAAWTFALFLASWSLLPLNEPQSLLEISFAAARAVMDVQAWARPLADVPADQRLIAAVALLVAAVPILSVVAVVVHAPARVRLGAGLAWLLACSAWLLACGLRDAGRLEPWREGARRQQELGELAGSVDARVGMLRREATWFRRRGDNDEAARVDGLADDLSRRLSEALRQAGYPAPEPPPQP